MRSGSKVVKMETTKELKPNPEGPVFISYCWDDGKKYANKINALLRAIGLRVWRDIYDMPANNMAQAVREVLNNKTSSAVLVVTKKAGKSTFMKKNEIPLLIQLAKDTSFPFVIVNALSEKNRSINYSRPDEILETNSKVLEESKQYDIRDEDGIKALLTELLKARLLYVKEKMQKEDRQYFTIDVESRTPATTFEEVRGDLQIRINPDETNSGKLSRQGLEDLKIAMPLVSEALKSLPENTTIRITGGMHLAPALAVGQMLPVTKQGCIEVIDRFKEMWKSEPEKDAPEDAVVMHVTKLRNEKQKKKNRVAVMVSMTDSPDYAIFDRMVENDVSGFDEKIIISAKYDDIDPKWGGELSKKIAKKIRSAVPTRPEIHLAYCGPAALAFLIGRWLNTYEIIAYERLKTESSYFDYQPILKINAGATAPIQEVFDSPDLGDDGIVR
jgi:hypothetical protein